MSASPLASLRDRGIRFVDIAKSMAVNKATVTRWAQRRVPAERVLEVEAATGVSRHELRPDIYGPAPATVELA